MSIIYAGLQGSYKSFEMALFQDEACLGVMKGETARPSSQFLLHLKKLLSDAGKSFSQLQFLAVDSGPGAFTSLRVIIASVNALAFETNLSLVGVDGLDALAQETVWEESRLQDSLLVSLLNAYNNEVYYAVHTPELNASGLSLLSTGGFNPLPKGYKKIDLFLSELLQTFPNKTFFFTGNGADLHKEMITQTCGEQAVGFSSLQHCSAQGVGRIGYAYWKEEKNLFTQLKPLYLKAQTFAVKK